MKRKPLCPEQAGVSEGWSEEGRQASHQDPRASGRGTQGAGAARDRHPPLGALECSPPQAVITCTLRGAGADARVPFSSVCAQNEASLVCVCVCVCVCSGYSCHSHPQGSVPWSLKGAGHVQDQNGFPRSHPLATWEAARIHSALNASWAFPQLTPAKSSKHSPISQRRKWRPEGTQLVKGHTLKKRWVARN